MEPVWLRDGSCLLVNEDGLSMGLELNPGATLMARMSVAQGHLTGLLTGRIVGPAVVVPKKLVKKVLGSSSPVGLCEATCGLEGHVSRKPH